MAQIIFEIGQDSLWQQLLQNTLPVPTQSHQASTLQPQGFESTHKSFRGGFLLPSKPANLKNRESRGESVTVNRYHVQSISSQLFGMVFLGWRRHVGSCLPSVRSEDINPILLQLLTLPRNGSKDAPKTARTRHKSTQRCRINQNCLKIPCK